MANSDNASKTVKMSLARALKEKSRIAKKLLEARKCLKDNNSTPVDRTPEEDPVEAYAEVQKLQRQYLLIKQAIARGNAGISDQLTEILVLRAELDYYSSLICATSTPRDRNGAISYNDNDRIDCTVVISAAERRAIKDRLEARINELQDEIDQFNATHSVEVAI